METEENKKQVEQAEIDDQVKEQKLSEEELEGVAGGSQRGVGYALGKFF